MILEPDLCDRIVMSATCLKSLEICGAADCTGSLGNSFIIVHEHLLLGQGKLPLLISVTLPLSFDM